MNVNAIALIDKPRILNIVINTVSVYGKTVRLRTPLGNKSEWKNYKAVKIYDRVGTAFFQNNEGLLN